MEHETIENHPHYLAIAIMAASAEQARNLPVAAMLWWQAAGLATNRINGDWAQHRAEYCCQRQKYQFLAPPYEHNEHDVSGL